MIILDSNIFVYLVNGSIDRQIIADVDIAYASVTKIETLGYWNIRANELLLLEALFGESEALLLTDAVVSQAVKLRQTKSMSLGDAIIAATALENDCVLWTANIEDFAHIDGLRLRNPLKA
jgi:predicted nucleic acid-binding protein